MSQRAADDEAVAYGARSNRQAREVGTLIDIVIQQVLFIANASDNDVHPDVAVSQLELLVAELVELPAMELASIRARVQERLVDATGPERQALAELDSMLE